MALDRGPFEVEPHHQQHDQLTWYKSAPHHQERSKVDGHYSAGAITQVAHSKRMLCPSTGIVSVSSSLSCQKRMLRQCATAASSPEGKKAQGNV
eukprot:1156745-Pelagomonas_calceolata.AAC.6